MKQYLLILILIILSIGKSFAFSDTLYLKNDSSLIIYSTQNPDHQIYDVKVYDKQKDIVLYEMPGWAATSHLQKMPNNFYHIIVRDYMPKSSELEWKKFEITRYILWVGNDTHSFFKTNAYTTYPSFSQKEISHILKESEDIHTNSLVEKEVKARGESAEFISVESYVRNIGLLAVGILNGDTACLTRFNEVCNQCPGGSGCEAYRSLQKVLSYTDYELWYRTKKHSSCDKYLRRKTVQ